MQKINRFRGKYGWLSNFYSVNIEYEGRIYPSVEHAFMSAKNDSEEWKDFCSNPKNTASEVKAFGREIKLIPDWDTKRISVMRACIKAKFSQEPFRSKLLATEDAEIIEGNTWGDTYWGFDTRKQKGKNYLGRIIMETRDLLKQ